MCRLFGLTAGERRVAATFWLLDDADSLVKQSQDNPDGAGLGTFDEQGRPVVEKQPLAAYADAAFHREAKERRSRTFVAHVRHATGTPLTVENTHPFELDGRLAAHNGAIEEIDRLEAELGDDMALVRGDTDSERIFALVTRNVRRGMSVADAMTAAAQWLGENVPVTSLNLVVTDESDLWAMRYPETDELWILEHDADAHADGERHRSSESTRVESDDLASVAHVLIASEKLDDDPGWRLLDPGTVLHVGPDLVVEEHVTIPDAPRRRPVRH